MTVSARVVAVETRSRPDTTKQASGYRISNRLLLTVAHALDLDGRAGKASVVFQDRPGETYETAVVWNSRECCAPANRQKGHPGRGEPGPDAAILQLTEEDSTRLGPAGPVRWGTYATKGWHDLEGVGFPAYERHRRTTTPRTVTGVIDTARKLWQGAWVLERTDGAARFGVGPGRAAGLSGTAMHSIDGGLLVGTLIQAYTDGTLVVMPAERMLKYPCLDGVFAGEQLPREAEPVLLSEVLTLPSAPPSTPAALLEAKYGVFPLQGEAEVTLRKLEQWCASAPPQEKVMLLHGVAQSGKTRIAHELVKQARTWRWHSGFVTRTAHETRLREILSELQHSTLLVVDEVETRPGQWDELRRLVTHAPTQSAPVRLLGLARTDLAAGHADMPQGTWRSLCTPSARIAPAQATDVLQRALKNWLDIRLDEHDPGGDPPEELLALSAGERLPVAEALVRALSGLLLHHGLALGELEPERILLRHEQRYAIRTLQACQPWLNARLCRELLTSCALFAAADDETTVDDIKVTLHHHYQAVRGFGLDQPSLLEAVFLRDIADTLALLYPSRDRAGRGTLPEVVRQAQLADQVDNAGWSLQRDLVERAREASGNARLESSYLTMDETFGDAGPLDELRDGLDATTSQHMEVIAHQQGRSPHGRRVRRVPTKEPHTSEPVNVSDATNTREPTDPLEPRKPTDLPNPGGSGGLTL
ncbi:hypothetical protein [Streptomyces sp. NPDC020362]|uniref:hypothetical protein n=1 Tax=unclassified Streptomyces TaxID=2593676 RepID=UPI000B0DBA19